MPIMQEMRNSMSGYDEIGAMNFANGFLLAAIFALYEMALGSRCALPI